MAADEALRFKGKIKDVVYKPTFRTSKLPDYDFETFDITKAKTSGTINFSEGSRIAYSSWVTPKRTRSFPFARIYSTYHREKVVTIIPIVKDEGKDGDHDRINFITLSWLNLLNVYIVLAWYDEAERVENLNTNKITNQRFNNDYIKEQLKKIESYKLDAHHWNQTHFREDFVPVFNNMINSYNRIGIGNGVKMHNPANNVNYLREIVTDNNSSLLDFDKFKIETLKRSEQAALRETNTVHELEHLAVGSKKGIFFMKNYLGGEYVLTCDEVLFENSRKIIIQESKNITTKGGKLPTPGNIQDGLFKLILFSNIDELYIDSQKLEFSTCLKLTGEIKGHLKLPAEERVINVFSNENELTNRQRKTIELLNKEAQNNEGLTVVIESN